MTRATLIVPVVSVPLFIAAAQSPSLALECQRS